MALEGDGNSLPTTDTVVLQRIVRPERAHWKIKEPVQPYVFSVNNYLLLKCKYSSITSKYILFFSETRKYGNAGLNIFK